ncbi:MAG: DeoR family transcriptional regulator [Candidatus Lokiarchaeota archaeon]|nr:DeoR family transcriptional regulator [Candidatus Lokiarchaeota archaeon]MBD3201845.1 DeoR family transcriptional regulator [Candidatus Lokiarchaeota archaeon]
MLARERRNRIANLVKSQGSVTIEELTNMFDVSRITIWKDLKLLEEKGFLARVHGGAMRLDKLNPEEKDFTIRRESSSLEKQLIAKYAAENYVKDNEFIFLDGGTTVLEMIPHLINFSNLTILTNGLFTLNTASSYIPDLNVICFGGILRKPSFTFVGPDTEDFITKYNVDTAFVSAFGITLDKGLTDPNSLDMKIKRIMCENARKVIVLIDSEKFGNHSLTTFYEIEEIENFITDSNAPSDFIEILREKDININIVKI